MTLLTVPKQCFIIRHGLYIWQLSESPFTHSNLFCRVHSSRPRQCRAEDQRPLPHRLPHCGWRRWIALWSVRGQDLLEGGFGTCSKLWSRDFRKILYRRYLFFKFFWLSSSTSMMTMQSGLLFAAPPITCGAPRAAWWLTLRRQLSTVEELSLKLIHLVFNALFEW